MKSINSGWVGELEPLNVLCKYCGSPDTWWGYKKELQAADVGTYSLAGVQMKMSVKQVTHPWAKCRGCGHESRGEYYEETL